MSKSLVGSSDLLTLFAELPKAQAHALAESLGYQLAPLKPKRAKVDQPAAQLKTEAVNHSQLVEVSDAPLEPAEFWRACALSVADDAGQFQRTVAADKVVWRELPDTLPEYRYLFDWPQLRRQLEPHLRLPRRFRRLDIPKISRRLARAETLRRLPHQWRERLSPELIILNDHSSRLQPYLQDFALLRKHLYRLWAPPLIHEYATQDDLTVIRPLGRAGRSRGRREFDLNTLAGKQVLVLSDLGSYERPQTDRLTLAWRQLGRRLRSAKCHCVGVPPSFVGDIHAQLGSYFALVPLTDVRLSQTSEHATLRTLDQLLTMLAPTRVIERGQLRDARLALGLAGADPALESYVWQHPDVAPEMGFKAALKREARERRLDEFDQLAQSRRQQSLTQLRLWRQALPDEVYFSELWDLPTRTKACVNAEDLADARDYLKWLHQQAMDPDQIAGSATLAWFSELSGQLSKHVHADAAIKRAAQQLIGMSARARAAGRWPDKPDNQRWVLAQQGNQFVSSTGSPGLGSFVAELTSQSGFLEVEDMDTEVGLANAAQDGNAFWAAGSPPAWAVDWGVDAFGAWVEFAYKRITQRLRWIPPGRFLMGSPDDEPGRKADEGPQHQVTLRMGYWLFDTTVSQALWQAVMDRNPSYFKGADLPVESVSWHKANEFIAKLNDALPDLQLSLPTAAQWEYACRAGRQSPFNTGENLTTDQANYNGEYPYADFPQGKFRGTTVPVKQFAANAWGLYQMHGNVWEWCADGRREYSADASSDPAGSQKENHVKVLRGGAWGSFARLARSAVRYADDPGYRDRDTGFRCARVQREPDETAPKLAGKGPAGQERRQPAGRGADLVAEPAEMQTSFTFNLHEGRSPRFFGTAPGLILRSDVECLTLECAQKPTWASAIGRDRCGLWCEFKHKQVKQRLRWIPPGRFVMGSPEDEPGHYDNEGPAHDVVISAGYWLFETPVTQALWTAIMGDNPSYFQSPDRPVEKVSWDDVQVFLDKINAAVPGLDLSLPSEAQWEYACRAGSRTAIYSGALEILGDANAPAVDPIAWYGGNSSADFELGEGLERSWLSDMQYPEGQAGTHPVGRKAPNAWGLYDMLGNVWEWCADGLREYRAAPAIDPVGPLDEGDGRVLRGGAWRNGARSARSAYRITIVPDFRYYDSGFRCARVQGEPGQASERRAPAGLRDRVGASGRGRAEEARRGGKRRV